MILAWITILLFVVSFFLLAHQYRHFQARHNIWNLRLGLMVGALALVVLTNFSTRHNQHPLWSLVFCVLALGWLAAAIQLWRMMPPRPPPASRY
jgi:uncharacterized membrane protein YoaK (UPF0700 family)